jgi:hypothetical protein
MKKLIPLLFLCFFLNQASAQCTWEPVGNNDTSLLTRHQGNYASVVVDKFDSIYSVYSDVNLGNKLTVKKYVNGAWKTLGLEGFTSGATTFNSIQVSDSGVPYVAFVDIANGNKATVMKFNGSNWIPVGAPGFSSASVSNTTLALDSIGTPYIGYKDAANGNKASVQFFNGTSWVNLGPAGFTQDTALTPCLKINNSGIPYLLFQDQAHSGKASLMYYSGNAWNYLGGSGFTVNAASKTAFDFDSAGTPYVAFHDSITNKISVMKYYNSTWVALNDSGIINYSPHLFITVMVGKSGLPYLACTGGSIYYSVSYVFKFNGATWQSIFKTQGSYSQKTYISLDGTSNSASILGYIDERNNNNPTILRWIQNDWESLSHPGIIPTIGGPEPVFSGRSDLLSFDPSGNLYYFNAGSNSVLKKTGGLWNYVGNKGDVGGIHASICFDPQQNPCIAYRNNSGYTFVKKFNGLAWNDISPINQLLNLDDNETSLIADTLGNLYVAADRAPGSCVYKYNGSNWDTLGSSINGTILKLQLNYLGELMMVKTIRTDSTRLYMNKFNGTSWTIVGNPKAILAANLPIEEIKATITKQGIAYVVYHIHSAECIVMKFDGLNWSQIGGSTFNLGAFGSVTPSIITDSSGVPYAAAQRYGGNGPNPIKVYRFNGNYWVNTGNIVSDLTPFHGTALAIDPLSNKLYVSFGEFCPYVKKLHCSITNDIESEQTNSSILLFPNPSSSEFFLKSENVSIQHIRIFNLMGKELENKTIDKEDVKINIANLPSGIYFVEVITNKERIIKKLVKE